MAKAILGAPAGYPTWLTRTSGAAWPGGTGVGGAGAAVGPAGGVWLVHASGSRLAATAIAAAGRDLRGRIRLMAGSFRRSWPAAGARLRARLPGGRAPAGLPRRPGGRR